VYAFYPDGESAWFTPTSDVLQTAVTVSLDGRMLSVNPGTLRSNSELLALEVKRGTRFSRTGCNLTEPRRLRECKRLPHCGYVGLLVRIEVVTKPKEAAVASVECNDTKLLGHIQRVTRRVLGVRDAGG
jgi:hypothetical protein